MTNVNQAPPDPKLEIRGARASSLIVQRIPPGAAEAFMAWQRNISEEAAKFPGYLTTEIYPPQSENEEWVIILHFTHTAALQSWLDSPQRAAWVAKLPSETHDFRLTVLPKGFGDWFAGLNGAVPAWKAILSVLLGLYPTVMLLHFFLAPQTQRFAPAYAILFGSATSVVFLQFLVMPAVTRLIRPWVGSTERKTSLLGGAAIVAGIILMAFLFSFAE